MSGTPTAAGTYPLSYRVVDGDENTAHSDADMLTFVIAVVPLGPISHGYRGHGDEVFRLNPEGQPLADALYTLELGHAFAQVCLIATNTTGGEVTPSIERLDNTEASVRSRRPPAEREDVARWMATDSGFHGRSSVRKFNRSPPSEIASSAVQPRQTVTKGDTFTFYAYAGDDCVEVPATAREVVTDGTTTAIFWIGNDAWGSCTFCVRQERVDALADRFLRPGAGNDIPRPMRTTFTSSSTPMRALATSLTTKTTTS